MSQENVEIVRRLYETTDGRLDLGLEFLAPEIELHLTGVFPDLEPVYRGHGGVQQFVDRFNAPWEKLSVDPSRFIDNGDRVLVFSHFYARGRDGIEVSIPLAHLWTLRSDQVVRMDAFADQEKALEAAGLAE